ncbi:MAG TPA: PaaI family thioesterase [Casimicrobiaceae bacterium]|nr:PaaI family thioesterase [Casimicrobiaceae bacterium]
MSAVEPTRFTPAVDDYDERIRESFARQGAMRTLHANLHKIGPGYCAITLEPRAEVSQQHGFVHAGVIAAIADTAGGYAGFTLFPADASVLTVEFKLNLLAPASGERIVAEGFVVKSGRTLTITRGEVHAELGGRRTLVALMQQTLMTMHGKSDFATLPVSGNS